MKKEDLLKVFPSLNEMEIQTLPNELVICWYPSSGVGADLNDNFCGYAAMRHWQEQPCKLKPNFSAFSNLSPVAGMIAPKEPAKAYPAALEIKKTPYNKEAKRLGASFPTNDNPMGDKHNSPKV